MSLSPMIDPLVREDWPAVRAIYAEGLATGIAAFSGGPPRWEAWDAGHFQVGRLAARIGGALVGWGALTRIADT